MNVKVQNVTILRGRKDEVLKGSRAVSNSNLERVTLEEL